MRSSSGSYRALVALAPLLIYTALTLLIFRPLLPLLGSGLHDRSDTLLNTWIVAWQAHILPRDPSALFAAPIFHPLADTLALSEILWPAAPIAVPLLAATGNPVLVYNLLFLAAFPLAGYGAYLLAADILSQGAGRARPARGHPPGVIRPSAFLAGLIYAFSPHQFGHLSQLQLLTIAWLPLALLFLDRYWRRGMPKDAALFALCALLQTLSAFYYGFQVALAVGLYLVIRPSIAAVRRLAGLTLWVALAALLLAPFAAPYLRMRNELGLERSIGETLRNAATLAEYLRPPLANPIYRLPPGLASVEGALFPGFIVILLSVLGVVAGRGRAIASGAARHFAHASSGLGRGYWLLLFLAALILSLGPRIKFSAADPGGLPLPFGWLYLHLPGMTAIRAPGRFANTAFLALAMLAAMGAAWLLHRIRGARPRSWAARHPPWVVAILAATILVEVAGGLGPFAVHPMPPVHAPLYAWLATQPRAAFVELPLTSELASKPAGATASAATSAWPDYNLLRYQYFQAGHWQPSIDGYSGFVPPHHRELGLTLAHFPDERSLALLRGLAVERVIVHGNLLEAFQPGRAADLRKAMAQIPAVALERDFGSDQVYRLAPDLAPAGRVTGRFWSTDDGQAFLLLASADRDNVVIPPGQPLRVQGAWQPVGGGPVQTFEARVQLPLVVGGGSVTGLELPAAWRKEPAILRLTAADARVEVAPYERQVTARSGADPVRLLPIQAQTLGGAPSELSAATAFTVTLPWRLLDRPDADASVSARVLDSRGQVVAQYDLALGGDVNLVRTWQPGRVVTTTHPLRLPDAMDRYTLEAFIYRLNDPADYLFLDAAGEPVGRLNQPLRIEPAQSPPVHRPQ